MPPLTEKDQAIRATGLGSSEIAAVAGENLWATPHSVWMRKVGLEADDFQENDATIWGSMVEPVIAARYSANTGRRLLKGRGTKRHPKHEWALCTIDFHFAKAGNEKRIVECKHVGQYVAPHWDLEADGIPPYCALQTQWQMGVLGISRADVAVVFGGTSEFRIYETRFDPETFEMLLKIGRKFWFERVLARVMPDVDESDEARRMLRAVYGLERAPLKDAPSEAQSWIDRREAACDQIKAAEKEKNLASNKLCEFIGDAEGIRTASHHATWKTNKAGQRVLRVNEFKRKAGIAA